MPAKSIPLHYSNNVQWLEADRIPRMVQQGIAEKEIVDFLQTTVLENSSNLKRRKTMGIWTLLNIERVEQLFVDYVPPYQFVPDQQVGAR